MSFSTKESQGWAVLKKTAGQSSPVVGTQIFIPTSGVQPRNPKNVARPDLINKAGSIINAVKGKFTPSVGINAPAHSSWFTSTNLNSLIGGSSSYLDANLDSDEYGVGLWEPIQNATRVWDGVKWAAITVSYQAAGGPIMVNFSGPGIYGESEKGTPTSFSAPSVVPGQLYNTSDVAITGADQVRSLSFTLMRGQGQMMYSDGTLYSSTVSSGKAGGLFTIEQSPTYSSTPSSTITIQIGPATTGVKFTFALDLDEPVRDFTTSFGTLVKTYTMTDLSAGNYPFTIVAGT